MTFSRILAAFTRNGTDDPARLAASAIAGAAIFYVLLVGVMVIA